MSDDSQRAIMRKDGKFGEDILSDISIGSGVLLGKVI